MSGGDLSGLEWLCSWHHWIPRSLTQAYIRMCNTPNCLYTHTCVQKDTLTHENMLAYTFLGGRAMPPVIDPLIHQMLIGAF